jgi:hypothetical protein
MSPEDPFWPPVWSNWAVLVLGGVTAWIALGSLHQLRLQVAANDEAARAANAAAKAAFDATEIARAELKLSKRAYVRVYPQEVVAELGAGRRVTCVLTNVGTLPGRLDQFGYHAVWSTSGLTASPDYSRITPIIENGQTIFPGENMIRNLFFEPTDSRLRELMPDAIWWLYGELRYRDVFGEQHRTRFCGKWVNGEFLSDGPAEFLDCD